MQEENPQTPRRRTWITATICAVVVAALLYGYVESQNQAERDAEDTYECIAAGGTYDTCQ